MNIVLWPTVFERYALLAKTATFLDVTGTLQAQQGVVHLVGEQLGPSESDARPPAPPAETPTNR